MAFSVTPVSTTVSEGVGTITFTITRTQSTVAETVYFSTIQNQGFTNNGDYTGINTQAVSFGIGVTSRTITVAITNDSVIEGTETFGVIIENSAGTVLDSSTFTITDNDTPAPSTFTLTPASTTVSEGTGSITFTVTRSQSSGSETVYFSTIQNQGFTNNGDYTGINTQAVSFSAGVTTRTISVAITNDATAEGTETFGAVIENSAGTVLDSSTFTITDNDSATPSTFTMTPASTTVSEGVGLITFTVTRSQSSGSETVYFSTIQNQGFTNSGDYTGINTQAITFASGVASQTISVSITNDSASEAAETFGAVIENSAGTVLDSSTFTITDNDSAITSTFTLTPITTTVSEGVGSITFTVTRSQGAGSETVYFSTMQNQGSTNAGDYSGINTQAVNFGAGVTSQTITVSVANDTIAESTETFGAIIESAGGTLLDGSTFTITDNDGTTNNLAPTASGHDQTAAPGTVIPLRTLFSYSDANGLADIVGFAVRDATVGGGRLVRNGVTMSESVLHGDGAFGIPISEIGLWSFVVGSSGAADTVRFSIIDSAGAFNQNAAVSLVTSRAQATSYLLVPSASDVTEGGQIVFTVSRSGDLSAETVYFSALSSGTATYAEGDFRVSSGQPLNMLISFAAGQSTQSIALTILPDGVSDSGETFRAIVQRSTSDPATTYLARSSYVTTYDVTHTNPSTQTASPNVITTTAVGITSESAGGNGSFRYPIGTGSRVTERRGDDEYYQANDLGVRFAQGTDLFHLGEDWHFNDPQSEIGRPVFAIANGQVIYAGPHTNIVPNLESSTFGNVILMRHDLGSQGVYYSLYAHLDQIDVELGPVSVGQRIGGIGETGAAANVAHLHFEIFQVSGSIDPMSYLTSGTPEDHRWGYTRNLNANFGSYTTEITNAVSYTEGAFTWHNPSIFLDRMMSRIVSGTSNTTDSFLANYSDSGTWNTTIADSGGNVLVSTIGNVASFLLESFEEVRLVGGIASDVIRIGALAGTTILNNTVYLDGGAGNDTFDGAETDRRIVAEGGSDDDLMIGGSVGDILDGGDGNDTLIGGLGDDVLVGGSGVDAIVGGLGRNELIGGTGNDVYTIISLDDSVIEHANEGIDEVQTTRAAFTLPSEVERLISTGTGTFVGIGNYSDNVIVGGLEIDQLEGRDGNDILSDGGGIFADALFGGSGSDIYLVAVRGTSTIELSGEGIDEVRTAFSIYGLQANIENLTTSDNGVHGALVGNILANTITGGTGTDDLFGREGNDRLVGGSGSANSLYGQEGDDVYIVSAIGDSVIEFAGQGSDRVEAATASFTLGANVEDLTFTGAATARIGVGNDLSNLIRGLGGDDSLNGAGGDDVIFGGSGADILQGGSGADQFRYEGAETGMDRILDFVSGTDRIALSSAFFTPTGTVAFVSAPGATANSANSTFLHDTNTGIIWYDDDGNGSGAAIAIAQLNFGQTVAAGDFIFY